MTPLLSLLGTAALVVAPVEPPGKFSRYQKAAEGLAWKEPADQSPRDLSAALRDYHLDILIGLSKDTRTPMITVPGEDRVLYAWDERGHDVFLVRDGVLYRADYDQISSGCAIVAFDLKAGKEAWKATLKGLGPIAHSKYRNRVWMEPVDATVFAVYGHESAGRYVELVDFKTGRTVGHKVFP